MQKANRGIRSDLAQMAGTNLSEALSVTRRDGCISHKHITKTQLRDKHSLSVAQSVWGKKRMEHFHNSPIRATAEFWVVAECGLAGGYRSFGGTCRLRHQTRYRPTRLHGVIIQVTTTWIGDRGGTVVNALCYESEGRGFDLQGMWQGRHLYTV